MLQKARGKTVIVVMAILVALMLLLNTLVAFAGDCTVLGGCG